MGACRRIKSIKVASIIKCDIDICIKPGNMKSTRQLVEERELPLPPPLTLLGLLVEVEDMTRYIVDYLNEQDIRQLFNTSMRLASMKKKFVSHRWISSRLFNTLADRSAGRLSARSDITES